MAGSPGLDVEAVGRKWVERVQRRKKCWRKWLKSGSLDSADTCEPGLVARTLTALVLLSRS